ncbi:alcohol dehydrogenase catalytic domain-containing protein [Priestia koreensis]|uniref:alcohol dehydrogenase catalytic domain-containing protein n=1 Tax=Priestia koreensis TaxID=284581 RepID=UPI003CFE0AD5
MKAVMWKGTRSVEVTDIDEPKILSPRDVIVKVTLTAVCGTDLHPYRGHLHNFKKDSILGHEFTGIIEEVGYEVKNFKKGDRVVASDVIACGECWYCKKDAHYQCESVSLFGYGDVVGTYTAGAQAEKVRVPFADHVLFKIPDELLDEDVLFVGDILATGYGCADEANIVENDVVVVVGGGPVGLMCAMAAKTFSPKKVFIIEPNQDRHSFAYELGTHPILPSQLSDILDETQGRGPDVVLEAVGSDDTLLSSMELVRPKGTVVCVGAHHSHNVPFNSEKAFAKELTLKFTVGNPIKYAEKLIEMIQEEKLSPAQIITHRCDLHDAKKAYDIFDKQEALKVVMRIK